MNRPAPASSDKTYTLTLTEDQAEILGYALTLAKRAQQTRLNDMRVVVGQANVSHAQALEAIECVLRRMDRIEEVHELLDRCPVTEGR